MIDRRWTGGVRAQRVRLEGLLSIVIGIAVWELAVRAFARTSLIVVPPSAIVQALIELVRTGELQKHIWASFLAGLYGYVSAAGTGIAVGMLMARRQTLQNVLDPWVAALYATPQIALAPLFVVWLGIGLGSKVCVVFLVAVFPILVNAFTGVKVIDPELVEAARSVGASERQVFFKVLVPGALPLIVSGLRLGLGRALIGIVVGELVGASAGLGYLISVSAQTFDTASLFVGVTLLAMVGVIGNEGLKYLEHRIAPWRERLGHDA